MSQITLRIYLVWIIFVIGLYFELKEDGGKLIYSFCKVDWPGRYKVWLKNCDYTLLKEHEMFDV